MNSIFFYRNPETTAPGDGNLQGLKIAIQPNISVAGWPTDAGSNALFNFTALEDATLVERLRRDGASLCGSLRTSEFGFGLAGNKAGAALKSQEADVELVMDLMGESRLAAALASVCGFKPSYGLVSRYGLVGLVPSMECWDSLRIFEKYSGDSEEHHRSGRTGFFSAGGKSTGFFPAGSRSVKNHHRRDC